MFYFLVATGGTAAKKDPWAQKNIFPADHTSKIKTFKTTDRVRVTESHCHTHIKKIKNYSDDQLVLCGESLLWTHWLVSEKQHVEKQPI